jgi:hypothetical protein
MVPSTLARVDLLNSEAVFVILPSRRTVWRERITLFRREKVKGFPMIFPATVTTLKM